MFSNGKGICIKILNLKIKAKLKLKDIITNFLISYVGEGRIIPKVSKTLVSFHAQRGIQEMSYDVFRSEKSQQNRCRDSFNVCKRTLLPRDLLKALDISTLNTNTTQSDYIMWKVDESPGTGNSSLGYDIGLTSNHIHFRHWDGVSSAVQVNILLDLFLFDLST